MNMNNRANVFIINVVQRSYNNNKYNFSFI